MRKIIVLLTALSVGFLVTLQFRSFALVKEKFIRDRNQNVFRELQILKTVNAKLSEEREELRKQLLELKTRASTAEILKKEEEKYRLLSGDEGVSGPGIRITLPKITEVLWFTDLLNEFVSAGAEAIAFNGVRVTNENSGFRVISEKTFLLGNQVLRPPIVVEAIGDPKTLEGIMLQAGSVISRMEQTIKNFDIQFSKEEKLVF